MTIGALNPIDNPNAWDVLNIAGHDTPASKLEWSGWSRPKKWDVKVGKGTAGSTETLVGLPPSKGKFKFYAWTPAHFAAWDVILPLLAYDPTKPQGKQAVAIYHPALADIDVHAVVVDDDGIEPWAHEGLGLYSRSIAFLEFLPAPAASAVGTPTSAATNGGAGSTPGKQPDPAIEALQKQAAALAKQAQASYNP